MSLIRPEAQAALWRWREVILGLGVVLLALWWGTTAFGFLRWVAGALGMAGGMLMIVGAQRGRFRLGADGFGVVQVIEGQIRYFGPVMGGAISMSELDFIELDRRQALPFWVLSQPGMDAVKIPIDAKGAEALLLSQASSFSTHIQRMAPKGVPVEYLGGCPTRRSSLWKSPRLLQGAAIPC